MASNNHTGAHGGPKPVKEVAPGVLIRKPLGAESAAGDFKHQMPAWIISVVVHTVMLTLFLLIGFNTSRAEAPKEAAVIQTQVEDEREPNLQNEDEGLDPSKMLAYNVDRIEPVSVPGPVAPFEPPVLFHCLPPCGVRRLRPPAQAGRMRSLEFVSSSQVTT